MLSAQPGGGASHSNVQRTSGLSTLPAGGASHSYVQRTSGLSTQPRRRGKPQQCSANKRALHTTGAASLHRGRRTGLCVKRREVAPPPAASGVWRLAGELGDFRVRPAGGEHLEGGGISRRRRGESGVVGKGKRAGSAAADPGAAGRVVVGRGSVRGMSGSGPQQAAGRRRGSAWRGGGGQGSLPPNPVAGVNR